MPLSLKQLDYLTYSNHSFNIAVGAVSSGKTFISNLRWYKHIYDSPAGCLLLMSGKTQESLYKNVIRELIKLNPTDLIYSGNPAGIKIISKNIEISCVGANDENSWKRIQGPTFAGWLADEIVTHPKSFVKIAQKGCRHGGKIWPKFWTTNPENKKHYIRMEYILNTNLDCKTWTFFFSDNPILSKEYQQELKDSYNGMYYNRLINAQWVNAEGLVYPEFIDEIHVIKPFKISSDWLIYRVIDWGFKNPFVCLWIAVDYDGRMYIIDEHYEAGKLIEQHAKKIKNRKYKINITIADHSPQEIAEMVKYGIYCQPAKKEVKVGIQKVSNRLKLQKDKKPRLYVFSTCNNTIREFGSYEWNEVQEGKSEKEEPKKIDDHTMDCIRYFCNYYDGVRWGPA